MHLLPSLQAAEQRLGAVRVVALGITNQRETTLVWDRTTGAPLYNAIVWLDGRTAELCKRMETQLGSKVGCVFTCIWLALHDFLFGRPNLYKPEAMLVVHLQDYFRSVTGLPISTYFSAFKYK
jgi:glycerol kinase